MSAQMDNDAREIAETLLAKTGQGLLTHDFKKFMRCFALPHTITTFDYKKKLETVEAFEDTFNNVCAEMQKLNVTDMVRYAIACRFADPDRIESTHVSHLLSGDMRVKGPYPVFSVLQRMDNVWKIASSDYAVAHDDGIARALIHANKVVAKDEHSNGSTPRALFKSLQNSTPHSGDKS